MAFETRVIAKLIGEYALGGLLLGFVVVVAWAPIPIWLKAVFSIPALGAPIFMVFAAAIRRLQGGASDVEITDGTRKFSVTNIRFGDLRETISAAVGYHRPPPLVLPAGTVVDGRAFDPAAVHQGGASLPDTIEVAPSLDVPADAASPAITPRRGELRFGS